MKILWSISTTAYMIILNKYVIYLLMISQYCLLLPKLVDKPNSSMTMLPTKIFLVILLFSFIMGWSLHFYELKYIKKESDI